MIIPYSSRNTRLFFFHYHHYRSSSTRTGTAASITMRRFHNYFANSSSALLSYTIVSSKSSIVLIDGEMFYKNANSNNTTLRQFANFSTGKSIPKRTISSTTTTIRPFKILGLQQVAVGSTDISSLKRLWLDVLGLEKIGEYSSQQENVIEDILKLGNDSSSCSKKGSSVSVEIDLMCPIDQNRSPKVRSGGKIIRMSAGNVIATIRTTLTFVT